MSVRLLSRGARDGPVSAIYGGRPAHGKLKKWSDQSNVKGKGNLICAWTLSKRNLMVIVLAAIVFFF